MFRYIILKSNFCSIKSETSFRSANDENRRNVLLDPYKINQTQGWLQTTKTTGVEDAKEIESRKKVVERNILLATLW